MILFVVGVYLGVVLLVGLLGHRLFRGTGEDFFLASRTIGPFVLLMTLFGTNMTAFTMLGASGEAYLEGVSVFALMGSSSAIILPIIIYVIGTRMWLLGKRHGYITQVQFFRDRFQSDALGALLFGVLVLLLFPYVLIGVKGGGDALAALSERAVPSWVGSALVCAVVFVYVTYGGMRSTAWVNTLQTLVFMVIGAIAFQVIVSGYGGFEQAMTQLRASHADIIAFPSDRHAFNTMASYLLMPLSVAAFPHIFSHWLSARSGRAFRSAIIWYPVCIAVVWVPSVVLGALGNLEPTSAVQGPILVHLILEHAGGLLAGLLAAGVFAAIMSSLDSQSLAVGTMFTQDIVRHYGFHDVLSDRQQVLIGRLFVAVLLAIALVVSQLTTRSIFDLGVWSLSGFAGIFPVIVASLFWRRCTKHGAIAGVCTVIVLWSTFFVQSLGAGRDYTLGGTGIMPVVGIVGGSTLAVCVVTWLTAPPNRAHVERFMVVD